MHQMWYLNRKDTQTLCSSYRTMVQIHMYTIPRPGLPYILQHPEATWRFLGCYSSTVQRSMLGMIINPPHFSLQWNTELQMSCNYCWTIMQTHKCATMMETLHCIVP